MNKLATFVGLMDEQTKERQLQLKEFNKKLGEPFHFISLDDSEEHGTGFFVEGNDIVSYERFSNGYHPETRVVYDKELIGILHRKFVFLG